MAASPEKDAGSPQSPATENPVEKETTPRDIIETDPPVPEVKTARTIPNGGLQAWLQVVGAFFLYFNTWGLLSSYGTFQAYYETTLLEGYTAFEISTIGSVQSFLLVFLGFVTGPIYDAGHYRHLLGAGSLLIVFGTLMQSICTEFWQLLLAQGFCIGIGCGCLSIMSVAITAFWFNTRLPIANGIAACGSGVGGVVFPIVVKNLLPAIGFAWTVRTVALIVLATLAVCNAVLRGPGASARRRALVHRASLADRPYVALVLAYFTVFLGLYTPFFYVESFAAGSGIASGRTASYLLAAVNLSSIAGRVLPNIHLAGAVGPMNLITATTAALAVTSLGFVGATSAAGVFAVAVVYGFLTGTFFALQPTIFVRLTADMGVMGTRFGMAFSVMSLGLLVGSPVSGVLQRAFGSYDASWAWAAVTLAAGSALLAVSRTLKVGPRVGVKI